MTYEKIFDALGDRTRRSILEALVSGPKPVGEIARNLPVSRPAVSQHLKVLLDAGLVTRKSEGRRNIYAPNRRGIRLLREYADRFWDSVFKAYGRRAQALAGETPQASCKEFAHDQSQKRDRRAT
jgi:DNA-binding transcriptional ArsR family regulator